MSATPATRQTSDAALEEARCRYVLRLADSSLVLGQRLGEWIGHAPALEEDLAIANLSLDLIGQARLLLTYAGELEGRGRDEDALAFLRDAPEFLNLTLAEQPNEIVPYKLLPPVVDSVKRAVAARLTLFSGGRRRVRSA